MKIKLHNHQMGLQIKGFMQIAKPIKHKQQRQHAPKKYFTLFFRIMVNMARLYHF